MARIGWVSCGVCGNPESSVSENASGTLSVSCHKCQFSGYAKAGSKAARTIRATLKPDEDTGLPGKHDSGHSAPAGTPLVVPPNAKNSVFSLGNL